MTHSQTKHTDRQADWRKAARIAPDERASRAGSRRLSNSVSARRKSTANAVVRDATLIDAAAWIVKLDKSALGELAAFRSWLRSSPENGAAYHQIQLAWLLADKLKEQDAARGCSAARSEVEGERNAQRLNLCLGAALLLVTSAVGCLSSLGKIPFALGSPIGYKTLALAAVPIMYLGVHFLKQSQDCKRAMRAILREQRYPRSCETPGRSGVGRPQQRLRSDCSDAGAPARHGPR